MPSERLDWLQDDIRDYLALSRYILFRCCKKVKKEYKLGRDIPGWEHTTTTTYKPLDFMDFKWIVDRCNFEMAKDFGLTFLPNSFLEWYQEAHFVPEYFDADFSCDYKKQKNGKLKQIKANFVESDFLSGAEMMVANRVIKRWKLYGHICQSISDWWWIHVSGKFVKRCKNDNRF